MSEWLKEHAWKACVGETLPWVRIPLSPPAFANRSLRSQLWLGQPSRLALSCGDTRASAKAVPRRSRERSERWRRRTSAASSAITSLPTLQFLRTTPETTSLTSLSGGSPHALQRGVEKRVVYILRSDRNPDRHYTGITSCLESRLAWHNAGQNTHTARDRPWTVVAAIALRTEDAARAFERYLKSGSGRAFASKHFP